MEYGDDASDPTPSIFNKNSVMTWSLMNLKERKCGAAANAVSMLRQNNNNYTAAAYQRFPMEVN